MKSARKYTKKCARKYTRKCARKCTRKCTRKHTTRRRRGGSPFMAIRLFGKAKKYYDTKNKPPVAKEMTEEMDEKK